MKIYYEIMNKEWQCNISINILYLLLYHHFKTSYKHLLCGSQSNWDQFTLHMLDNHKYTNHWEPLFTNLLACSTITKCKWWRNWTEVSRYFCLIWFRTARSWSVNDHIVVRHSLLKCCLSETMELNRQFTR